MKPRNELDPDIYAAWRASELGRITEALEDRLLDEMMGDPRDMDILDVGCGDGTSAIQLARRGARVVGVDISADMIEAASERGRCAGSDARFYEAAVERLPFAPAQFDVVLAKTILCFVDDATNVFAELTRVLRPGGRLVIGELGKWSAWAAGRRMRAWLGSPLWRRAWFRTASELRSQAGNAGLRVTKIRGAIYYPRLTLAARLLKGIDPKLGRVTTVGAAFIAMCAVKPMEARADSRNSAATGFAPSTTKK